MPANPGAGLWVAVGVAGRVEGVVVDHHGAAGQLGQAAEHADGAGSHRPGSQHRQADRPRPAALDRGGRPPPVVGEVPDQPGRERHVGHAERAEHMFGHRGGSQCGCGLQAKPQPTRVQQLRGAADPGGPLVATDPQVGAADRRARRYHQVAGRRPGGGGPGRRQPVVAVGDAGGRPRVRPDRGIAVDHDVGQQPAQDAHQRQPGDAGGLA